MFSFDMNALVGAREREEPTTLPRVSRCLRGGAVGLSQFSKRLATAA